MFMYLITALKKKWNKTKQKLVKLEDETVKSTNIIGDFSSSIPMVDRRSRQKISK